MHNLKRIQRRIFKIIEPAENGDKHSKLFDQFIIFLIIANILSVILESFKNISTAYKNILSVFEIISIVIFTIEYMLRLFTAGYKHPSSSIAKSIVRFSLSPMALIDLFAILPFYIPLIIRIDLRFLRILRLTRLLRILKVNRYSKSLQLLGRVLKRKKEELLVTLFVTMLLMLLAASIMYHVEADVQPTAFPNIIASFWWAIATLTTVGYGDVFPITVLGKTLAGIIALLGIGLVALPTGIISSGFLEDFNENRTRKKRATNRTGRHINYRKNKIKLKCHRKESAV